MYLIKLSLPINCRSAAEALADSQKMHRMLSGIFAAARNDNHLLYRMHIQRGSVQIYIYSDTVPEYLPPEVSLIGQRDISDFLNQLQDGRIFGFDLLAMPSKKVYQSEGNKNSQRRVLRSREDRMKWLARKADQNGFRLLQAEELEQGHYTARHGKEKGGVLYLDAYHYQGMLQITDSVKYRRAMENGIGSGKAYGLGMLMVKPL